MFCYRQDRNLLWGASGMCQHCNQSMKTMHKQPTPPLKQVNNQEDGVKTENTENILPLILEPITNTNKELELEEEIDVVKMVEEII
ncbi:hypothetical protein CWI39_0600p0010 [Hamiltosporidium magnivora]|uniref:Uncharacterized protein n=1 Tax=Hamiltosporidium magnivora TaxID=148818 RepID=A0A4Q9LDF8_9MICR|nr:hypothetical protein CWI39_0600p0010 [Hamiltosporidium magnivora]